MSDEDEQQTTSNTKSLHEINRHRLSAIKLKLQALTREKTKYNVEKLTQDADFLRNEISHLSAAVNDINKQIISQTNIKKTLNAKMQILRSSSRLHYTNLQAALQDKERYEKELEKPNKPEDYRKLAQKKIESIVNALPQFEEQDKYSQQLEETENEQITARNKREKILENLNSKSRKQAEIKQLLNDSATKLPELEAEIENLRLEREKILSLTGKKQHFQRSSTIQEKSISSSIQSSLSLEQETLEYEKQSFNEQLEKIRLLLTYFHEKLSEHNLTINDTSCTTPTLELISPLYSPLTPMEEQTILSSYMDEKDNDNDLSTKTDKINESTIAIAMKLPRNFISLDLQSAVTNEIIHSPYCNQSSIEYKKELPSDIVNKYAGISKKKQQQFNHGKKNKKNKKGFIMTHSSQMISLYNDIRTSTGNSETLPSMPMYEYELLSTIKALQLMEQSIESYLSELSKRDQDHLSIQIDEEHSDLFEDDDIRDSALDTFSEGSSLIEALSISKDSISVKPSSINIPQAPSSSSSDDKKTIVSSSSPPSDHSHTKTENQPLSINPLTTVEESPTHFSSLTMQIAQIERQISDEGYRSVRNGKQQQPSANNINKNSLLLTQSHSYDCTDKVDRWLSSTATVLPITMTNETIYLDNGIHFQATNINDDNDDDEENRISSTMLVSDC